MEPIYKRSDSRSTFVSATPDLVLGVGVDITESEKTKQAERRADFDAVAEQHYANIVSTGKTIPWAEMRKYLEVRVVGKPAMRPVARKLAR